MLEIQKIQTLIYEIRGQKVMLDADLAPLYEVEVKKLNQAVKRNIDRFPNDFMFQLTAEEQHKVVTNCDHLQKLKYRPTLMYAFTEEGVAMLSAVLKSQKAVDVSLAIMRAFVKMREYMLQQASKTDEIRELKQTLMMYIDYSNDRFDKHTEKINKIIQVLNALSAKPEGTKNKIGFDTTPKK